MVLQKVIFYSLTETLLRDGRCSPFIDETKDAVFRGRSRGRV